MIKCYFLNLISFCSLLILIFSIVVTLNYPKYFVESQQVWMIKARL